MKELTCIVCPNGCRLMVEEADGGFRVTGNRCKRGEEFEMCIRDSHRVPLLRNEGNLY